MTRKAGQQDDMVKSMTGFAARSRDTEIATIGVTIRAVNHRHFDLQLRLPQMLAPREPALRALVQRCVPRGRLEVTLTLQLHKQPDYQVDLNQKLVVALQSAVERARQAGAIEGSLSLGDLLRLPQALAIREVAEIEGDEAPTLWAALEDALQQALGELDEMRVHEGAFLKADLDARQALLDGLIARLEQEAAEGARALRGRLSERIAELVADPQTDPALIAQEIVRMVSRSDISEELVRFRAHLAHWTALVEGPEPCGRKLDFLLQEMNREVNTIGSKAEGVGIGELIVTAKAELEKMREQVQNVE